MISVTLHRGPAGRKTEGFFSAARANITESASTLKLARTLHVHVIKESSEVDVDLDVRFGYLLVCVRIRSQFDQPSPSPLQIIGKSLLFPNSTISPNLSHMALSPGRISLVRQWTVKFRIPVRMIRETNTSVDG